MKNTLKENMRRFGTKNLMEQTNNDLADCLKRNGFRKNTAGQHVNTEFNIYHQGKYTVSVYISIGNKDVLVKVRDAQAQMHLPTMKFGIPQDCDMFVDLLKNRIREKIDANKS
jgi:hypothetical protein